MELDTLAPLIDVQPAYKALVELTGQDDVIRPEAKAFLRFKLKECIRELRKTAKYLDDHLKDLP